MVYSGDYFSIGLKYDSTLWSWGSNTSGQLGDSTYGDYRDSVLMINNTKDWQSFTCGLIVCSQ